VSEAEMKAERYQAVLEYWFGLNSGPDLWFGGNEVVDGEIRDLFSTDLQDAIAGRLSAWEENPEGTVALVVLLDQFSLQLYRDQRAGYDGSALAILTFPLLLDHFRPQGNQLGFVH
jgi:uncharacterized protein (DUF924 family)